MSGGVTEQSSQRRCHDGQDAVETRKYTTSEVMSIQIVAELMMFLCAGWLVGICHAEFARVQNDPSDQNRHQTTTTTTPIKRSYWTTTYRFDNVSFAPIPRMRAGSGCSLAVESEFLQLVRKTAWNIDSR